MFDATEPVPADGYERMAEFHDLFMDDAHARLAPVLATAFGALPAQSVLLDLGAGTGLGVRQLAAATSAGIIAAEPSLTMRAILLARVADDSDLAARVSVVADAAPELSHVPAHLNGFVCAHMLGHLSGHQRRATFRTLAERIPIGGRGVVTVNGPLQSDPAPVVEERVIGAHRYLARHLPPTDAGPAITEYEVRDRTDRLVRSLRCASTWRRVIASELVSELDGLPWRVESEPHASVVPLTRVER